MGTDPATQKSFFFFLIIIIQWQVSLDPLHNATHNMWVEMRAFATEARYMPNICRCPAPLSMAQDKWKE